MGCNGGLDALKEVELESLGDIGDSGRYGEDHLTTYLPICILLPQPEVLARLLHGVLLPRRKYQNRPATPQYRRCWDLPAENTNALVSIEYQDDSRLPLTYNLMCS